MTSMDHFPTETAGLAAAHRPELVELGDGDRFELRIAPVTKRIGDATVRMLAYNGSIPGPTLKVREGCEVEVDIVNDGDHDTTVHWHGLRLENRYDGTHETQTLIPVGGRFTARVAFPDPGIYWYHPHVREDYGQELGLYGNVLVDPTDPDYWPPVNREVALTLDDILLEDGKVAPFSRTETNYAAMGRFGDVLLISGEPELAMTAKRGEVVRFYLTDTANTRVFKVALPGARLKLVGGDSGRHASARSLSTRWSWRHPSARSIDVVFEESGQLTLEHRTPDRTYPLATIDVSDQPVSPALAEQFDVLRTAPELAAERDRLAESLEAEPDKTLAFVAEMDFERPCGRPSRLRVPDASRGRERGARPMPGLRDEAAALADGRCRRRLARARRRRHARARRMPITGMPARAASSGRTTWSTSTG